MLEKYIYMPRPGQSGQAMLAMVVLTTVVSTLLVSGASIPAKDDLALSNNLYVSKQSSLLSESGLEDVSFRIRKAWDYDTLEILSLNGFSATTSVATDLVTGVKTVLADSSVNQLERSQSTALSKNDKVSFNYGVQAGNGGFTMANTSSVLGNIYSNGQVSGSGNLVTGSVVSAGPTGLISGLHVTGTAWARTITNSTVDGTATYNSRSGGGILNGGTPTPGYSDPATTSFPISDTQIAEWEAEALAGGVISSPCPYQITTMVTLGPKKINCDLEISNGGSLTLSGMLWVNGNFTVKNNSGIRLDPSLGARSVALIADNVSNRTTSSLVDLQNSVTFSDSGTRGSFLFLISANSSSESGGAVTAIDLKNTASGPVILYANHGKIAIANSSQLKSVTGYLITMRNSAQLIYDSGLASSLFDTGPGGSWAVESWKEVE